jgi:peptide/nickel transport system substrate-binding protein
MYPFTFTRRAAMLSATLAAAGALLATPAGAAAADEAPKRGGTLVLGNTQTPRHLNGAVQSGIATAVPSTQIFASPLRFDDKWNPQPYLAESWKLAEDGKSLTLNLPKNIYGDGQDLKTHPRNSTDMVGSGPFKLVEFKPGQRIVMERFDKFFLSGKPYLDKVIVNITPDMASLMLGLERGDVQMLPFASVPTDLKRLATNPQVTLTPKGYEGIGAINWLAFNLTKKPLSDVQVRKAIATAIDKNFITKALMAGFATPADGPIVASSPFAVPDLVRYPVDLKKAAEMLDAAGYKAGAGGERFKLTIDYLPGADDQQKTVAEYIRGQLKKVGIAVEVRASADFPAWAKRMASHDFDMSMDLVFNWGDPIIGVHRTYLSTNIKPVVWTNTQSYSNPKVDELLNTAGGIIDPVKRKAYYATFEKIVTDELPIVFINQVPYHTAVSKKVANVPASIWGPMSPYDEVYFK